MSQRQAVLAAFNDPLTEAEREVWEYVEDGPYGARQYARLTDRSPGTISNLLRRARAKQGRHLW